MEKRNKTQLLLKIMNVLFWIVFIGLVITTAKNIFTLYTLVTTEGLNEVTYIGVNPLEKLNISLPYFIPFAAISIIVLSLKTYISYIVVKISSTFDLSNPFTLKVSRLISNISYVALAIGIFQLSTHCYYLSLLPEDSVKSSINASSGDFLFLAAIIFIIAQIFKRGLELQTENELTI